MAPADDPVHRDPFPRPDDDLIAHGHVGQGQVHFTAVFNDGGGLGPQPGQLSDGLAGPALGGRFQEFAELDQGDDDRRCFKIDMVAEGRKEQHRQGIAIGHRRSHGHQDVHVGAFVPQAVPAAAVEIPSGVELDRRGQGEKKPVDPNGPAPVPGQAEIPAHAEQKQGQGEGQADKKFFFLLPDLPLPGQGLAVVGRAGGVDRPGAVAGFFNGGDDVADGEAVGVIGDVDPLGGEIDRRADDAGGFLVQGPFDVGGAVGAGHAGDAQGDAVFGHNGRFSFGGLPDQGLQAAG